MAVRFQNSGPRKGSCSYGFKIHSLVFITGVPSKLRCLFKSMLLGMVFFLSVVVLWDCMVGVPHRSQLLANSGNASSTIACE